VNAGIDAPTSRRRSRSGRQREVLDLTHEHSALRITSCVSSGSRGPSRWRTRQRQRLAIDAARQLVDRPVEQRDRAVAGEAVGHTRDVGDAEFQRFAGVESSSSSATSGINDGDAKYSTSARSIATSRRCCVRRYAGRSSRIERAKGGECFGMTRVHADDAGRGCANHRVDEGRVVGSVARRSARTSAGNSRKRRCRRDGVFEVVAAVAMRSAQLTLRLRASLGPGRPRVIRIRQCLRQRFRLTSDTSAPRPRGRSPKDEGSSASSLA